MIEKPARSAKFKCLGCSKFIDFNGTQTSCFNCGWRPSLYEGKPSWVELEDSATNATDPLDKIKGVFKQFPRVYSFLIALISPVFPWAGVVQLNRLLASNSKGLMVNVGSGADRIHPSILNLDIQPFKNVDALVDATNLPLESESVDLVISIAVLEHVKYPEKAIAEIVRIIRPGGVAFVSVPFMAPFHASPQDYQRYTLPGLVHQFRELNVEKKINVGPTSALIWVLAEWMALFFSFGSDRLQAIVATIFGAILSPIKFLDGVLRFLPGAVNISTSFTLIMRKPIEGDLCQKS
jgi:SAM-dependent methyltransferase